MKNIANLVEGAIRDYVGAVHFIRCLKQEKLFKNQKIGVVVHEIIGTGDARYGPGSVVVMEYPEYKGRNLLTDGESSRVHQETLSVYQLAKRSCVEMLREGNTNFFGRVDNVPSQYVRQLDLKDLMKFMDAAFATGHYE